MLTSAQNTAVIAELLRASRYPKVAVHLWALCIEFVDPSGTGEILLLIAAPSPAVLVAARVPSLLSLASLSSWVP